MLPEYLTQGKKLGESAELWPNPLESRDPEKLFHCLAISPFVDWNFSNTTEEDYQWLVDCIHGEGRDIYVADFSEQGA